MNIMSILSKLRGEPSEKHTSSVNVILEQVDRTSEEVEIDETPSFKLFGLTRFSNRYKLKSI